MFNSPVGIIFNLKSQLYLLMSNISLPVKFKELTLHAI